MKGRDPIEEYPRAVSFYPRNKNPPFQIQPSRKKVSREIISETLHGSKSFPAICGRICGFYECQKFPRLSPKDAFARKKDGNSGLENRIGSVSRSWDWAGVKSWKDRIQSACKSSNAAECGAICLSLSLSLSFPSSSSFYFVVFLSLSLSRPRALANPETVPQSRWITYTQARFYSATGSQRAADICLKTS